VLPAVGIGALVAMDRRTHGLAEPAGRVLLHLFAHDIHLGGQGHAMLAGTRIAPPQLDEFFLGDEKALRSADFAALGFTEQGIWQ
jgi:uncharacterized damage-inducible protein DinB